MAVKPEVLLMESGPPEDFNLGEIECFIKSNLIVWGNSLQQRLERCVRISILRGIKDSRMVGLAAIKTPFLSYRRKILGREDLKYELGYVAMATSYRGLGLANRIIQKTISNFNDSMFATVNISNELMSNLLLENDFVLDKIYASELDSSRQICLYVRGGVEDYGKQIFSGWFPVSGTTDCSE